MSARLRLLSVALALGLGLVLAFSLLAALGAERAALAESGTGVIRVATTGSDAAGCGGASSPCRTIQYAVDAAQPGDEIRVATGVYTGVQYIPALNTSLFTATQLVAISKSLRLSGGYAAGNWETPDASRYPTTLDAEGAGRVVLISGAATVTLEGLRITGGNAAGLGGTGTYGVAGGGVWAQGAAVTIADCEIRSNAAFSSTVGWMAGLGGGVYLRDCPGPELKGNTVVDNAGSLMGHGHGGGVYMYNCSGAHLVANVIQDNLGATANGYGGGVDLIDSSDVVIEANIFQDNVGSTGANYYGGGLYLRAQRALVVRNTFRGNVGGSAWSWGGGAYVSGSPNSTIAQNTFEDNVASSWQGWGGGLYLNSGWELTIDGNVFRHNKGTVRSTELSWGGGAYLAGQGYYTLTNNAFVENEVTTSGSGLCVESARALLLHNTFSANLGGDGSGVSITGTLSFVTATNTIVADHALGADVTGGAALTLDTTLWYGNGQDWQGNVTHSGDRTADPLFAADGYHLTRPSPAVDQAVDAGVTTDIDSQRRPGGPGPDIGADEYMSALYLPLLMRRYPAGP
jgi:hypothetical protein